jgi:hypothetical protein
LIVDKEESKRIKVIKIYNLKKIFINIYRMSFFLKTKNIMYIILAIMENVKKKIILIIIQKNHVIFLVNFLSL